jgi:hypothetical protein
MSITNNGTAVSKKVTTTGIEAFADEQDNTSKIYNNPPVDPDKVPRGGPGKDQG